MRVASQRRRRGAYKLDGNWLAPLYADDRFHYAKLADSPSAADVGPLATRACNGMRTVYTWPRVRRDAMNLCLLCATHITHENALGAPNGGIRPYRRDASR